MSQATLPTTFNVDSIRRDFPIFAKPLPKGLPLVFLDTGASAQKPQVVIDKEREVYENYYANAYRGVYRFGALVDEQLERSRATIARFVNASRPEEIIFTAGTTASINAVAQAWGRANLRAGDEVLLNEMEHHANFVPWQQIAAETGASLRFIPLTEDGRLELERLDELLTPLTKMLTVTGMSNVLGTINPIETLAQRAHAVGALIFVDGAQSVPHMATDVRSLDIDFLAFSGHKLYGPSGVGVLYGKHALLEAMPPFQFGGHMIDRVFTDHSTWAAPPAKFEAGTLPIAQAIALGTAVDYVTQVGIEAMHEHENQVLRYAIARLNDVPGLRIAGPAAEHRGAIISFTIDGLAPEDLAQLLDRRGVFVRHGHHCTMPLHDRLGVRATVRASFGMYNTLSDVDALFDAIQFARQKLRVA
ncbi:MAG: SufS family cysteine desulfurase [Planctomycetales bacterium]|nr:SufS family cysteine desulfurase [Planctomycetales bacterium]